MSLLVDVAKDNDTPLESQREAEPQKDENGFVIPEKFKGKSAEEIARSYVELEKDAGRLRNEVGDYRSMTDRLLQLEEKRVKDLEGAGGQAAQDFNIDPAELLSNPRESLAKWYEYQKKQDPEFQSLQQRLEQIEGHVKQQVVHTKHGDADQITQDPEFLDFVKSHPVRLQIAQAAVQGRNVEALDYLLTEYKERKGSVSKPDSGRVSETTSARSVVTEKASSGGSANARHGGDKVFSRRKLIQLKMQNPEEYSAMQDQILLAYAQGRVVD